MSRIALGFLLVLVAGFGNVQAQSFRFYTPGIQTNAADTSDIDSRAVYHLWYDYLHEKDSVKRRSFWTQADQRRYRNVDQSAWLIANLSNEVLVGFLPNLLNINRDHSPGVDSSKDSYTILTLFASYDSTDGITPYALSHSIAIKEKGLWKLTNSLPFLTRNWRRKTVGPVTFVYSPNHTFKLASARSTVHFIDSVTRLLRLPPIQPFDFYVCENVYELTRVVGFDYNLQIAPGFGTDEHYLMAGNNSEWYPHEVAHMIMGSRMHRMLSEGVATWLAGNGKHVGGFRESMHSLKREASTNDSLTVGSLLTHSFGPVQEYYYALGALLCDMVYARAGADGLKRFLDYGTSDDDLWRAIQDELGCTQNTVDSACREYLNATF